VKDPFADDESPADAARRRQLEEEGRRQQKILDDLQRELEELRNQSSGPQKTR
jgi:hypothetical protein